MIIKISSVPELDKSGQAALLNQEKKSSCSAEEMDFPTRAFIHGGLGLRLTYRTKQGVVFAALR